MKKLLIALIILVTVAMAGFAIYVKDSNKRLLSLSEVQAKNCYIGYEYSEFDQYYYYSDLMNYESLKENSDLIVEVTCRDQGSQRMQCILRKCSVNKIISGDYDEDYLYLYEPSFVSPFDYIEVINGYLNMKEGQTYIVFLKKVNAPNDVNDEYSKGYYLTSAMYGKYKLDNYESLFSYQEGDDIYYEQIMDHETMLVTEEQVNIYNDILKILKEK